MTEDRLGKGDSESIRGPVLVKREHIEELLKGYRSTIKLDWSEYRGKVGVTAEVSKAHGGGFQEILIVLYKSTRPDGKPGVYNAETVKVKNLDEFFLYISGLNHGRIHLQKRLT